MVKKVLLVLESLMPVARHLVDPEYFDRLVRLWSSRAKIIVCIYLVKTCPSIDENSTH